MKRKIYLLLAIIMGISHLSTTCFAKVGDVIGYAKYTDIACYINHYPIKSYNLKDRTAVVAEDLRNYGFDVIWNENARKLTIFRNTEKTIEPNEKVYKNAKKMGQDAVAYLETNIKTYANGKEITSYNIGGRTVVFLEELSDFGEVVWVPDIRALKMWIEDLPIAEYAELEEEPYGNEPASTQAVIQAKNPFEQLKEALISKGEFKDEQYALVHDDYAENIRTQINYDSSSDAVIFAVTGDLKDFLNKGSSSDNYAMIFYNNSDIFSLYLGAKYPKPNNVTGIQKKFVKNANDWAKSVPILAGVYDDTRLELYSNAVCTALSGANSVLLENKIPITVKDLGFINF